MSFLGLIDGAVNSVQQEQKSNKAEHESHCACGRKVCCGKHKNGQCACHKGKERE